MAAERLAFHEDLESDQPPQEGHDSAGIHLAEFVSLTLQRGLSLLYDAGIAGHFAYPSKSRSGMKTAAGEAAMNWTVYLSGEIHTDWRQQIMRGAESHGLPITFTAAVTDHDASDAAGDVLGREENAFWRDQKSSKVNAIRTHTLIKRCDMAVIRFGDQYKQWNAAFDAGYCAALGKPYITLHGEDTTHPLKEVDGSAMAWAQTPEQVVELLKYVTSKQ